MTHDGGDVSAPTLPLSRPASRRLGRPRRRRSALVGLVLGAGLTAACRDEPPPSPRVLAAPIRASPWTEGGRRPALRAPRPSLDLRLDLPAGARRAVLHVTALDEGHWPLRGEARARVRVEGDAGAGAAPEVLAEAIAVLPVRQAEDASWHELVVELPESSTALRLSADPGRAERIWWSEPHFEGVAPPEPPAGPDARDAAGGPRLAPPDARNVLLVSLDTVRADAVGHLGQVLSPTPRLDELAAEGTTWTDAVAPSSWTLPSHVSALTGLYPSWHGHTVGEPQAERGAGAETPTLATLLTAAGWESAAFTGEGFISWAFGPTRGFSLVVEQPHTPPRQWLHPLTPVECRASVAAAIEWLEQRRGRDARSPFFLFWHTYEPHSPYTDDRFEGTTAPLPPGVAEDARPDWQRYLGDLAAADECLGALLDALERLGLESTTDVLVFSDHGEEFGEHSEGRRGRELMHGHGSWETLLRVPLVARAPSIQPGRRDEQVTLLDVFPTVLAFAELDAEGGHGHALQVPGGHEAVAAEALNPQFVEAEEKTWRRDDGMKWVMRLVEPPEERLVDVERDPLGRRDLSAERPGVLDDMRGHALGFFSEAPPPSSRGGSGGGSTLPPRLEESLRSLGYVQ